MNRRRKLLVAIGAGALIAPLLSLAQQQTKVWRIGYISTRTGIRANEESFRQSLRELGYVEGQNIVIEWRFAKGQTDLYPELASELVRLKVDCIITSGIDATLAARQATRTIPIVMVGADDDPVRHGLVASLARPGGNVTGFISISVDLAGKRLQLLKETLSNKASYVAILWDSHSRPAADHVRETEEAARTLGVKVQSLEVPGPKDLEQAFRAAVKGRAQALIVVGTGLMLSHQARIANLAITTQLPVIYTNVEFVRAGGLMSYATADSTEARRGAATYVDKILKGAKPADLPVVQPTKFELVINLKAAKQIGLTIPPSVLARADKVIE